jgi:hypothetical protein
MKRFLLAFLVAFLLGARLEAQTLVSVTLEIYQQGATGPFMGTTFVYTPTACDQPVPAPVPLVNPTRIWWDDPINVGRACIFSRPTFLASIPIIPGFYTATATVTDDLGHTARSAESPPFQRLAPVSVSCTWGSQSYPVGATVKFPVKNSQRTTTENLMTAAGWFLLSAVWSPPNYALVFRCGG